MDCLLDVNVAVDVCLRRAGFYERACAAFHRACASGRVWLYTGSVQMLECVIYKELRYDQPEISRNDALRLARTILTGFCSKTQWLAALAEDGDVFGSEDPEDEQLVRAVARLGPDAKLLTRDARLLESCPQAISPEDFLALDLPEPGIEFIDLKSQQDVIRPQLETGIHKVLHHGRYILGPEMVELEERLADYSGAKHALTVASGTDALLVAMMALGIGPGDEVVTVPYTWISTAEMIVLLGAKPVFVDIDEKTWNMDPALLEAAITERTRAIMPVGIYGQPADMTAINEIAARHGNLPVIEDAAQCFGGTHHGKKSCSLSTIGSTSFFPSKPLGGYGDGGAVFTDDDDLAEAMRQIRVHGQAKPHHHPILGINGRFDSMQAAVVMAKLDIFDDEIEKRQSVAARYGQRMGGIDGVTPPFVAPENTSVYAQYTILAERRDALREAFAKAGVPAVAYYAVPLHLQPVFADLGHRPGDFPVTERVAAHGLSLPMNPYLTEEETEKICAVVSG
jgi:UDP-2-acetamido-2-deoxy-ribo-hexuluronate aminotransferase